MTTPTFRSMLAYRILSLIAVALPATVAVEGCFSPCEGYPKMSSGNRCIDPAKVTGAGGGGAGGDTSAGGGGAGGGGAGVACPSRVDAEAPLENEYSISISEITSDGVYDGSECCYDVIERLDCQGGRPFLVAGELRTSGQVRGKRGWELIGAEAPETATLDPETRARLEAEWARDGLFEHASVASFSRFALDLLAAGAPSDLVEDAHRAALDEVRHARLCLALASAYAGEDIAPGPFPAGASVDVTANLAALAARCAEEGAIGETVAAVTAAEQLARATDPAVRAALAVIAEDEARHAELAWRTVAWAIHTGGAPVRAAVSAVFKGLAQPLPDVASSPHDERLVAHGRLGEADRREVTTRAIEEIVLPAARLLLASESRSTLSEPGPSSGARSGEPTRPTSGTASPGEHRALEA